MKTYINFVLVFLILSYSCSQKTETADPTIIVSGNIKNLDSDEIGLFHDGDIASGKVDDEGNFKLVFDGDEGSFFTLYSGNTHFGVYLTPGDSIYLTADASDVPGTFDVIGDHEKEIRYLFEKGQYEAESGLTNQMELMAKSKDEYFKSKDSLFALSKVKFEEFKKQENLDPEFITREEAYFSYAPLGYDFQYPMVHAYVTKKPQDSIDFPMDEVNAKLAAIPMDQAQLLNTRYYTSLIDRRISTLTDEVMKGDSSLASSENAYEKARMLAIDSLLKDKGVKDYFL